MIRYLIGIFFFISLTSNAQTPQEITFHIIHNNKIIGDLTATKTIKDTTTYYNSSTNINTRIIKNIHVNHEYNVVFNKGVLSSANVNIRVNDKQNAKTITTRKNNSYQIIKNGKYETPINTSINYATVQLYFEEPIHVSQCYSEQNGDFNSIIAIGNHTYKKVNAKNNENLYYYNKGELTKAVIDGGLITFQFIRKSNP
ncbi:DUF6134 family protein [Lacinutrix undariae]